MLGRSAGAKRERSQADNRLLDRHPSSDTRFDLIEAKADGSSHDGARITDPLRINLLLYPVNGYLRSNLVGRDPGELWLFYLRLGEVEQAFRTLKGDLSLRPVFHWVEQRIEAHILVAFLAYCLHVTLKAMLACKAPGLTPRCALEKLGAIHWLQTFQEVPLIPKDLCSKKCSRNTEWG